MVDAGTIESESGLLIRAIAAHDGVVGDPKRYGSVAAEIAAEARAAGAVEALVVALRGMAWFERSRLRNRHAVRLLDEAASLARNANLSHRLGEVLITRAAVEMELGRVAAAGRSLDQAGALIGSSSAPDLELKRAVLSHSVGRIAAAADGYRRVLADPRSARDVQARAGNNLALTEMLRGRTREAMHHIDRAIELADGVAPGLGATFAHNRGLVLAKSGRLAESMRQLDAAIALVTEAGLPQGEFLADNADTLAELQALPEALQVARRAATELEVGDVPLMAAQARLRVAEVALVLGDLAAARGAAADAAAQFRRQRRPGWYAMAVVTGVDADTRSGHLTSARLAAACRAADTLDRLGMASIAVRANLAIGRAAIAMGRTRLARRRLVSTFRRSRTGSVLVRLRGRLAAALAAGLDGDEATVLTHCRAGLADLARHRAALGSMELRALASGHGVELGLLGLGVLLRFGSAARVLDWVERTRAVALLTAQPPAPDELRDDRVELAVVHADLAAARRDSGAEPAALIARQRAIEHRIRRATWHRAGSGTTSPVVSVRELTPLVGDRVLVSFGRFEQEMFAVVVNGGRRRLHRLGPWAPVRFEADALLFALRRLTRPGRAAAIAGSRASAEHSLDQLAELLLRPLGLDPAAPLVIVPARDTHRVPWPALHAGPVTVAPSASLWARTERGRAAGTGPVVVVAGPGLPGADLEAEAVARRHPGATVLSSAASTPDTVLGALAGADLVHLACHGVLRADNPTFSALEVASGQVTVYDLDARGIAPRRIVLAACDSAADVVYGGDEFVGFVSALLSRGTAGVVASVVSVGDVEAVELMSGLHENLAGGAPMAEALHAAKTKIDPGDPRQFVNRCAFVAYGAG